MKILCCTYRDWANKIYHSLEQKLTDKTFIKINSMEFDYGHIETIKPDLILWYGWSKIIPKALLKKYYSVMLHPSPLPLYRGGSPIQNQIINGEEVSAVTLFKMDEGIDTGDIISQVPLSLKGDLQEIFARIVQLGTNQTRKMITDFPNLKLKKQDNSISSSFIIKLEPCKTLIQMLFCDLKMALNFI